MVNLWIISFLSIILLILWVKQAWMIELWLIFLFPYIFMTISMWKDGKYCVKSTFFPKKGLEIFFLARFFLVHLISINSIRVVIELNHLTCKTKLNIQYSDQTIVYTSWNFAAFITNFQLLGGFRGTKIAKSVKLYFCIFMNDWIK